MFKIKKEISSIFHIPKYWQNSLRIDSLVNFSPMISFFLELLRPSSICEIGANRCENTIFLMESTEDVGTSIDVVDLKISRECRGIESCSRINFFEMPSLQYLKIKNSSELYIIDGDHNYQTVSSELQIIAQNNECKCIILHDTGWPAAYRNFYYDRCQLVVEEELDSNNLLSPFENNIGRGVLFTSHFSSHEGGERNGVRCAVENFLETSIRTWVVWTIPSILGLTILIDSSLLSKDQMRCLDIFTQYKKIWDEFLSGLEINRLMLLQALHDAGAEWDNNQAYIKEQNARLQKAHDALQRAGAEWDKNQAYIKEQNARLQKAHDALLRAGIIDSGAD